MSVARYESTAVTAVTAVTAATAMAAVVAATGPGQGNSMAKAQAAAVRHRSQNPGYVRRARGKEAAVSLSYRLNVPLGFLCSSLSSCFYIIIRGQETHAFQPARS
jgi:hypothetical protein